MMKLIFEMTAAATLFVSSGAFLPVPAAHLAGAMVGLAVGMARLGVSSARCVTCE
jgi:hypothetical protein